VIVIVLWLCCVCERDWVIVVLCNVRHCVVVSLCMSAGLCHVFVVNVYVCGLRVRYGHSNHSRNTNHRDGGWRENRRAGGQVGRGAGEQAIDVGCCQLLLLLLLLIFRCAHR